MNPRHRHRLAAVFKLAFAAFLFVMPIAVIGPLPSCTPAARQEARAVVDKAQPVVALECPAVMTEFDAADVGIVCATERALAAAIEAVLGAGARPQAAFTDAQRHEIGVVLLARGFPLSKPPAAPRRF